MDALNLFVFGAGYSASAAIDVLTEQGDAHVAATTRSSASARALAAQGIEVHVFDGNAPGPGVAASIARATHLLVSIPPGADGDPTLIHHARDILAARNLEWFGYYSTVGVYGDTGGAWIDESAPVAPLSDRNRYRVEAEDAWRDLADKKNVPLAILRLAGIYGPGRSAFDKLENGTAHRIIKPGQVFNRIHRDDIARITARAARARLGGTYNACDDEPAPPQDLITFAADLVGVTPPPEIPFGAADLSPMARTFYAGNRRISNAAIKSALGYELVHPDYRAGLAAIHAQTRD